MANHKSAEKRIRQSEKRAKINKSRMSRIKTFIKKFETALTTGSVDVLKVAFSEMQSQIQKGVSKGVLKKNTASRKISRMNARYKAAVLKAN